MEESRGTLQEYSSATAGVRKNPSPTPVLGILGTIFGCLSLFPFFGIISPLGLLFSVIGLIKDKVKLLAIVGVSVSMLGVLTSPILWAISACMFHAEQCADIFEGGKFRYDSENGEHKEAPSNALPPATPKTPQPSGKI